VPGYNPTDFARWLRQRRAIRSARAGGPGALPNDPDFYDGDHRIEHDPRKYAGCLASILIAVVILVGVLYWILDPFGGSDGNLIGSPTIAPATTATTGAPNTTGATTSTTTAPQSPGVELPEPVGSLVAPLALDPLRMRQTTLDDLIDDLIDSISENEPGYPGREIDLARAIVIIAAADLSAVDTTFNDSVYECGAIDPLVVCSTGLLEMPAGEILVVAVEHADIVPTASTERSYIYSLVFDSDGDPANDWQFNPPFDWDFFIGADRWYQAVYSHSSGQWLLDVQQVSAEGIPEPEPSAVRVVIQDEWVVWFVPSSELPDFPGRLRAVAFAHDGRFTEATRGGDVTGANPTEPLFDPEG
jgi:hypothetical protein